MEKDRERIDRVCEELKARRWDALVSAVPQDVLMLSGYWPVLGPSIVVLTQDGLVGLVAPREEEEIVQTAWSDICVWLEPMPLQRREDLMALAQPALGKLLSGLGVKGNATVSYENPQGYVMTPPAMNLFGERLRELLPGGLCVRVSEDLLPYLGQRKTSREMEGIRTACQIARDSFEYGVRCLHAGRTEVEVAECIRSSLAEFGVGRHGVHRSDGSIFCMGGPNASRAHRQFQITSARKVHVGESLLIHCNSYADGFWTDITRTFTLGHATDAIEEAMEAVSAARHAALNVIAPGVAACEVDEAARSVLGDLGYAKEFRHPSGHGVGFQAIDHYAEPVLSPPSRTMLEEGMVFNLEPAIYREGEFGVRQCDMVAVGAGGPVLLTPFLDEIEDWMRP